MPAFPAKWIFILCIVMVFWSGCHNSSEPGTGAPLYPFAEGNTWVYNVSDSVKNFQPVQAGYRYTGDTVTQRIVTIRCEGMTTLYRSDDSVRVWWMHLTENSAYSMISDQYYQFHGDTLVLIAYRGDDFQSMPKQRFHCRFKLGDRSFSSPDELRQSLFGHDFGEFTVTSAEITYEEHPPAVFVYPLLKGRQWHYRIYDDFGVEIAKEVLGTDMVRIGAGWYPLTNIEWQWHWTRDAWLDSIYHGYEYIGSRGLLERRFVINASITDEESNILGTADFIHRVTAISFP